jgi:hypothetical protein
MILEDATKEAFGYYAKDLKPKSHKCILVACEICGEFRVSYRYSYHTFCKSCGKKGDKNPMFGLEFTEEQKHNMREAHKGHKHPWWKPRLKHICFQCGKEFETTQYEQKRGLGLYCCIKCAQNAKRKRTARVCLTCGIVFGATPYRIKNGWDKFCSQKCRLEHLKGEGNPMFGRTGKDNPKYKDRIAKTCLICGKKFFVLESQIRHGGGKYCSRKCFFVANKGETNPNFGKRGEGTSRFKGGKKLRNARKNAKRRRELGYTLLMPLAEGDEGHHVTNEYVIGIPAEVHSSIGGSRKKHRTRVLQWLKDNDKKKYLKVLCVLAKEV